jgi:hypothetical protein
MPTLNGPVLTFLLEFGENIRETVIELKEFINGRIHGAIKFIYLMSFNQMGGHLLVLAESYIEIL